MILSRAWKILAASIVACWCTACASATVAQPPRADYASGHRQYLVGSGLGTPTAFAFVGGKVLVADAGFGAVSGTPHGGGVFVLQGKRPVRLAGSPRSVYGLAWRNGTLYLSDDNALLAWSHWTGSSFSVRKTIFTAPTGFTAFNGIGFGADGRLYAGVNAGGYDYGPAHAPYLREVLSMNPDGHGLKVVARGLRQPWQLAFPAGSSSPFVSVLGQDGPSGVNPPDYIVRLEPGENYGFPACNWLSPSACRRYAKPLKLLAPHSNPTGLVVVGDRLYVALWGNGTRKPEIASMPLRGGGLKAVVTGFSAHIVALGSSDGWLYVGDVKGRVYRVKL